MNDQPSTSTNIRDIMIAAFACIAICVFAVQFRGCAADDLEKQRDQYHRWDQDKAEKESIQKKAAK